VRRYREILDEIRPEEDAVWLPLDDVSVNDDVILPMLLEASWNRNLVIFSSNLSHVQKGILLAIYPDNRALGQRLGEMIAAYRRTATAPGVKPAADLQVAMNQRTAAHIGLRLSSRQQNKIALTFPSR
jgi:putative ABC transport system substrate-binding protein